MLIRNHTATTRKIFLPDETRTEDPEDKRYVPPEERAWLEVRRWTFAEKRAYLDTQSRRVVQQSDYSQVIDTLSEPGLVLGCGNISIVVDGPDGESVSAFDLERNEDGSVVPECWDKLPIAVLTGFFQEFLKFNAPTIERAKKSERQRTTPREESPTAAVPAETQGRKVTGTEPDGVATKTP